MRTTTGAGPYRCPGSAKAQQGTKEKAQEDAEGTRHAVQAMAERGRRLHYLAGRAPGLPATGNQRRARASSSSSSGCAAAAIPICRKTTLKKSTIAASPTPTSTLLRAFRAGRPIAVACTSCGAPPTKWRRIPTGGTYDRPMEEGGGSTTTYPWETWRYRYMEGIGENVIWEFVDPIGLRRISPDDGPVGKRRPCCTCPAPA